MVDGYEPQAVGIGVLSDIFNVPNHNVVYPTGAFNIFNFVTSHRQTMRQIIEVHLDVYVLFQPGNRNLHAFFSVTYRITNGLKCDESLWWSRRVLSS